MKPLLWLLAVLLPLSMGGCWGQADIDKVGPILQLGIESGDDGRLLVTHSFPVFGAADRNQEELVSMQCAILRESREIWRKLSPQIPQGGMLQQYMIAAELARKGIFPWLEVFQRDPLNPPNAHIVVVDGSPKRLMEKAALFKDKPRTALYIKKMLENNNERYTLLTDIFQFNIKYFAPGIDAVTPLIKLEPKAIRLTGLALFSKDRMVGAIDTDQAVLLLAMMGCLREAEYIFRRPPAIPGAGRRKPAAAAQIAVAKRKVKLQMKAGRPEIELHILFTGVLDEYRWDRMDRLQSQRKLEQSFAGELNRRANELLSYLQQVGSDPIGIGDLVRAGCDQYWRRNDPEQVYQTARIRARIKFRILKYGAIR